MALIDRYRVLTLRQKIALAVVGLARASAGKRDLRPFFSLRPRWRRLFSASHASRRRLAPANRLFTPRPAARLSPNYPPFVSRPRGQILSNGRASDTLKRRKRFVFHGPDWKLLPAWRNDLGGREAAHPLSETPLEK
jgi:hypothetical protein